MNNGADPTVRANDNSTRNGGPGLNNTPLILVIKCGLYDVALELAKHDVDVNKASGDSCYLICISKLKDIYEHAFEKEKYSAYFRLAHIDNLVDMPDSIWPGLKIDMTTRTMYAVMKTESDISHETEGSDWISIYAATTWHRTDDLHEAFIKNRNAFLQTPQGKAALQNLTQELLSQTPSLN